MSNVSEAASETWRDVPGYEGRYIVSDAGRVISIPRVVERTDGRVEQLDGRTLRTSVTRKGYELVYLSKNGITKSFAVHRIVALAFMGEPENMTVNHKNEIKTDNRLSNLEYMTKADNKRYSSAKPVESFDLFTGETVGRYEAISDVESDGYPFSNVAKVCRGERCSCHGLGWRFANRQGVEA